MLLQITVYFTVYLKNINYAFDLIDPSRKLHEEKDIYISETIISEINLSQYENRTNSTIHIIKSLKQ